MPHRLPFVFVLAGCLLFAAVVSAWADTIPSTNTDLTVIGWNVESGGADTASSHKEGLATLSHFVSPHYLNDSFPLPWTLDTKIMVFEDRVIGWQLDIAHRVINGRAVYEDAPVGEKIPHSGFAVMQIVTSYFEMLGKYTDGYVRDDKSKHYFRKGVYSVFPVLEQARITRETDVEQLLDILYEGLRCGLYHAATTDSRIVLSGVSDAPIGVGDTGLVINPHILVPGLIDHFIEFCSQLRNPTNSELRRNFEKRFDYDMRAK